MSTKPGWAFPTSTTRKCHYFGPDGRSLCRKYGSMGRLTLQSDNGKRSPDDCTPCRRMIPAPAEPAAAPTHDTESDDDGGNA